jgi:hypothetical protein
MGDIAQAIEILRQPGEQRTNSELQKLDQVLGDIKILQEAKMSYSLKLEFFRNLTLETYDRGHILIREGAVGDKAYIIITGLP